MPVVDFQKTDLLHYIKISLWSINQLNWHNTFSYKFDEHDLSVTHLTSKISSTRFSAKKTPTPTMPLSFPSQNILCLESFLSTNLADTPLHFTSCKPQMSTLCLDIILTTSFDWPPNVTIFYKHTLKFRCDNWLTIW